MTETENLRSYFSERIEESMGSLYGVARRLTGNGADAEDLVAECVARAWAGIAGLEDRGRFRPWIFRILHNCFISDYRKKAVRPAEAGSAGSSPDVEEPEIVSLLLKQPDDFLLWWGNPEREFANSLLGEDIMAAIQNLPEVFRMTVLLINLEGFSYEEAAEIQGVPAGTIRSRMKRGRTLLQKALWEQAREAGLVPDGPRRECRT